MGRQVTSHCGTACVLPIMRKEKTENKAQIELYTKQVIQSGLYVKKRKAGCIFSLISSVFVSHTYAMISCMQEVKELFCAVLFSVGPGPNSGFTGLQTLLVVYTVFSLLTLDSYRF